jgi:Flp pilus assembly protein TadG
LLKKFKNEKGQAMVEFAFILPILLVIICGIIDFGWLFYNQYALNNGAREGARFAVVNASFQNSEELIENKVDEILPASAKSNLAVVVTWSNTTSRIQGDVTVELNSTLHILTPVLGVFYSNQQRPMYASVTMKVES